VASTTSRCLALFASWACAGLALGACGSDEAATTTSNATAATSTEASNAQSETSAAATDSVATAAEDTSVGSAPVATEVPSPSVATTATTDGPVSAANKEPIVLAAFIDETGPSAGDGPAVVKAVVAWAKYRTENGGLNGHPITVDVTDTKGDAATALAAIDSAMEKNPLALILSTSSTETAMAESLAKTNVPVIGVGYAPAVWGGSIAAFHLECSTAADTPLPCAIPNAFTTSTTTGAVVDQQVLGAKAAGATKLAVAACSEVDSCGRAYPVFEADAKALGLDTSAGLVKISSTASDYTAECITFVQSGVDFIQVSAAGDAAAKLWSDCQDQGYTGILGASAGSVSGDLIKVEGIKLAGGIQGFPWWVDDAPVAQFRDEMEAGGVSKDDYSSPTVTAMYASLQLFAKANADLPDSPTAADALAAMYTINGETLDGLLPPVTFTEGQTAPARPCFWPYSLTDGVFTNPLGGLMFECYPPQS